MSARDEMVQAWHRECLEKRMKRRRVFCWLPTKVWKNEFWRDGFRWLEFVWLDQNDGKHYTEQLS